MKQCIVSSCIAIHVYARNSHINAGFHSHGGYHGISQKWLVYFMENPHLKMDDDWGYPDFRKPPVGHPNSWEMNLFIPENGMRGIDP